MIERFEISYVAECVGLRCAATKESSVWTVICPSAAPIAGRGVLVFGAPERPRHSGVAAWDTLPSLPEAAAEARDVARVVAAVAR